MYPPKISAGLLLGAFLALPVHAEDITQSIDINFSSGSGYSLYELLFKNFDNNLGSLLGVDVTLTGTSTVQTAGTFSGAAGVAFDNIPVTTILTLGGLLDTMSLPETDYFSGISPQDGTPLESTGTTFLLNTGKSYTSNLSQFEASGTFLFSGVTVAYSPTFTLDYICTPLSLSCFSGTFVPTGTFQGTGSITYHYAPNVAAIPEANTGLMMVAGLGLLGFAVRRSRIPISHVKPRPFRRGHFLYFDDLHILHFISQSGPVLRKLDHVFNRFIRMRGCIAKAAGSLTV